MLNVYNTPREKELAYLLSDLIDKDGYELIRIRAYKDKNGKKCQIMIDKIDGTQSLILADMLELPKYIQNNKSKYYEWIEKQ